MLYSYFKKTKSKIMGKGENLIYEMILTLYSALSLIFVVNATGYSISSSNMLPSVQIRHYGETEPVIQWVLQLSLNFRET